MNKFLLYIRRCIYLTLFVVDKLLERNPAIFILCYHGISADKWKYGVAKEIFQKQINYLLKHYSVISLDDLALYLKGKKTIKTRSVIITFDDGYQDILAVRDFIKQVNIRPALFVLSDRDAVNRKELDTKRAFLTNGEILRLKKDGWIIGCHSATHPYFKDMLSGELDKEIIQSKKTLEKELGFPIRYFAYPKGVYTKEVLDIIKKAKYTLALTMDDYTINSRVDALRIPRIGVDRTHSFIEFKTIFLPGAIAFRKIVKKHIGVITKNL